MRHDEKYLGPEQKRKPRVDWTLVATFAVTTLFVFGFVIALEFAQRCS